MDKRQINPWDWQDRLGFSQAWRVDGAGSIVKLVLYLTDTAMLRKYARVKAEYITGPQPASTAIGVASLALPGMLIELDATAVR